MADRLPVVPLHFCSEDQIHIGMEEEIMCRIIAIANQKGGVTKTTSAVNLGIGLARHGKRVLLVDADAQGSLTASLGYAEPDSMEVALPAILAKIAQGESVEKDEGILEHEEGISLMPCNIELSAFEVSMAGMMRREYILKQYLDMVKKDFDYIIVDCMPSLGMITINALTAADSVIIPVQATYLPVKGLEQLLKSIGLVKRHLNPGLTIEGILVSMVDGRTRFSKDIIELLNETYGEAVRIFDAKVPVSVRAAECPAEGVSIYRHDPKGRVAAAYEERTEEVLCNG